MERTELLELLHAQIDINGHIIGAAVGSGMTAKYAAAGGADFLLALSAGKYRIMGRSSYASYFSYGNNNEIVMDMGIHELLPITGDTPLFFGLFASDPELNLYEYLKDIKSKGFTGIVNFPTMSLIDGQFRIALEEEGNCFEREIEAIKVARFVGLATIAFVTTGDEAVKMTSAGADIICVHLGLTRGGYLGAKKYMSIEYARKMAADIFRQCSALNPEVIRMIYAGPANTPKDMLYMYKETGCQGYIGGSTFDRIPIEKAVYETTLSFKNSGNEELDALMAKAMKGGWNPGDYTIFVKEFIERHYMNEITLGSMAIVMHITPAYLSTRFKSDTGQTFSEYLIHYRMERAKELLRNTNDSCTQVAGNVGYTDYAQFSKMFKKYCGQSPAEYRKNNS